MRSRVAETTGSPAERLLSALEAAWPADACRGRPSAAFLVLTSPGEDLVAPGRGLRAARLRTKGVIAQLGGTLAADELADRLLEAASIPHPQGPGAPALYLSLLQPPGGFDVVPLLRQAYEQTASTPDAAPSVGTPTTAAPTSGGTGIVRGALVAAALAIGVLIAIVGIARRLRQMNDEA